MNHALDAHKLGISLIQKIESHGFTARFAGGSVRDRLLGRNPHDYDIATDALPEQICSIFAQKPHKVIPTGLDHGTVTVVYRTIPFEITTLRKDVRTDGRHAEVAFGGTFAEDAERRDFTVNAMFEDADGKVYDYFTGREDLHNRLLRFVGEPHQRIKEDYLRILRFFRFWAKLDFSPDPAALAAIAGEKSGLAHISVERITSELTRMLKAGPGAIAPLKAMADSGVLEVILTITPANGSSAIAALHSLWAEQNNRGDTASRQRLYDHDQLPLLQLALIIKAATMSPEDILKTKLRLSNSENRLIVHFLSILTGELQVDRSSQAAMMEFLDGCDKASGSAGSFLELYHPVLTAIDLPTGGKNQLKAVAELERTKTELRQAKLPLSGKDLAKLGIPMDKTCGEILARLKTAYRNEEWTTAQEGLALAKTLHSQSS